MTFGGNPYKGIIILWHSELIPTKVLSFYDIRRQSLRRDYHFMTFGANLYKGIIILWHSELIPTKGISIYKFFNAKKTTHLGCYYLNGLFFILDRCTLLIYGIQLSINKVFFLAICSIRQIRFGFRCAVVVQKVFCVVGRAGQFLRR